MKWPICVNWQENNAGDNAAEAAGCASSFGRRLGSTHSEYPRAPPAYLLLELLEALQWLAPPKGMCHRTFGASGLGFVLEALYRGGVSCDTL